MQGIIREWKCQPEAEKFILDALEQFCRQNGALRQLSEELTQKTSTRLLDWVDYVSIGSDLKREQVLLDSGYEPYGAVSDARLFHHPGAQLPRVVIRDHPHQREGVAVSVEHISQFLMVRGRGGWIEGSAYSPFRRCCVSIDEGVALWVVERRGGEGIEPIYQNEQIIANYLEAKEKWSIRPRHMGDDDEAMHCTLGIAEEIIALIGVDMAAWVVLEVEREYWQSRNTAGQLQKNRQDRLGMGWANHDHHTFRSSRRHFTSLVRLFEMLGFHCRERFYAGEEAGWGAQVMEHASCRLVLFLDVDLAPQELEVDFAHQILPERKELGTIGLWCALHGDSILQAGMHHLEAQFLFEELSRDLAGQGVKMMDPFSSFPYLKQAFTQGELWKITPERVTRLLKDGLITAEQAEHFKVKGAVGSHLENLQRREGYKGFNQKNVSWIIRKTDPRVLEVTP